jgi:hypothetical protein
MSMDHSKQPRPTRYSLRIGIPFVSLTMEGEILRREARRLRKEFTREKRDEIFATIESNNPDSSDARRAQAELSYYLAAFQVNSSERGARQLSIATWVLALATIGLLAATVILAVTSSGHGG